MAKTPLRLIPSGTSGPRTSSGTLVLPLHVAVVAYEEDACPGELMAREAPGAWPWFRSPGRPCHWSQAVDLHIESASSRSVSDAATALYPCL